MYDSIHSFFTQINDTDNVHQVLWLINPSLLIAVCHNGYGLHQWDMTLEQFLRWFKVDLPRKCSLASYVNENS